MIRCSTHIHILFCPNIINLFKIMFIQWRWRSMSMLRRFTRRIQFLKLKILREKAKESSRSSWLLKKWEIINLRKLMKKRNFKYKQKFLQRWVKARKNHSLFKYQDRNHHQKWNQCNKWMWILNQMKKFIIFADLLLGNSKKVWIIHIYNPGLNLELLFGIRNQFRITNWLTKLHLSILTRIIIIKNKLRI